MEAGGDYFPCVSETSCPYTLRNQGCHEIKAHLFYPAADYQTPVERVFRNLPENVETRCRRFEEESHGRETPPPKPSREEMLARIVMSGVQLSETKKRRIFGRG